MKTVKGLKLHEAAWEDEMVNGIFQAAAMSGRRGEASKGRREWRSYNEIKNVYGKIGERQY